MYCYKDVQKQKTLQIKPKNIPKPLRTNYETEKNK